MAFGQPLESGEDLVADINMVPLIDVMLVLLIVFMVTLPVLTHSVRVDLPRATNASGDASARVVELSITRDGDVYWDRERLDADTLEGRLREAAAREPQPELRVRGDRHVEYGRVAAVMAAVQRAGLARLAFVTQPAEVPVHPRGSSRP